MLQNQTMDYCTTFCLLFPTACSRLDPLGNVQHSLHFRCFSSKKGGKKSHFYRILTSLHVQCKNNVSEGNKKPC